jgi:hypothetical protein
MRLATSDWHLLTGEASEPADRDKIDRLVALAINRHAEELIIAGDCLDATRGSLSSILDHAGPWFLEHVAKPLALARVFTTFILGNHDWLRGSTATLARALYDIGVDPHYFQTSTGPEHRGPWQIEHGNRWDAMCKTPGGLSTRIGEAATRLVGWLGPIVGTIDPKPHALEPGHVPALDSDTHQQAMRWAYGHGASLIIGHTHTACDIGGPGWRLLDTGSATRGTPFSFVWIGDGDETAGVEIEP